MVVYYN